MIDTIYVERTVGTHARTQQILERFPRARVIDCETYQEVFNRQQQNFRVQKNRPSLILTQKSGQRLYPVPRGQALGAPRNFYFSHLLNCPFDCRYCFLQGMFTSANYVLFVNYEDFVDDIHTMDADGTHEETHYFSGYDCDSLALEPLTGFAAKLVTHFAALEHSVLELRTKSTQIRALTTIDAHDRCIVAMSLAPSAVIERFEHGTPPLSARLDALNRLQHHGWPIGLRFDPVLPIDDGMRLYSDFFAHVFAALDRETIHSVTLGGFRLPKSYAKRMTRLHPDESLFATTATEQRGVLHYGGGNHADYLRRLHDQLARWVPASRIFIQGTIDDEPTEFAASV